MDTLIGPVPDDWRLQRLDDCCYVQPGPSGSTLKASDQVSEGVPVVTARDVDPDGISLTPKASVSITTAQRLQQYQLQHGDTVLVRIGDTTRHAMVKEEQSGWLLGGSCIRLQVLRYISAGYLTCYLTHPAVREWLTQHTRKGVMPTLSMRTVGALPLVVPPAAVQQTVLDTARDIDAKIRAHKEVIRATQALRELLLPRLLSSDPEPYNS